MAEKLPTDSPKAVLEKKHRESLKKYGALKPNKLTEAKVNLPKDAHAQVFNY